MFCHVSADQEKRVAAQAAAQYVESGMTIGLGTGSTVAYLLPAIAARGLDVRCVSTSPRTEVLARELGLRVETFEGRHAVAHLDLAIDGADQVDPAGWIVKGGGAAHTREKRVAASADRFLVIVSSDKMVQQITAPIPLELLDFGLAATLLDLGEVTLREVPPSPDGGVIADYRGAVTDVRQLAQRLDGLSGVIDHGLFAPALTWCVLVGRGADVERIDVNP